MKNNKERHFFSQTGPGGRKCACCSPAPGPERKQFDRQAKRREKWYWKNELLKELEVSKICPKCKTEVLIPSEEMRNKVDNTFVCDDCYYESLGSVIELHPVPKPIPRRGHGRWKDDY